MGIILLFVLLEIILCILVLCICLIKKPFKKVYIIPITCVLMFVPAVYGILLFLENLPFKNSDLDNVNINSYYINQEIDLNDKRYYKISETDNFSNYEIVNSNMIQLTISKSNNKIIQIIAYHDEENKNNSLMIPSVKNLLVDISTFNEVTHVFGKNYNKLLFSDAFEKVIIYKDMKNRIEINFCFNSEILTTINLKQF